MANLIGTVKRAYPLQALNPKAPDGGELGTFGPGVGPCGLEASRLMVVVLENPVGARTTFETFLVFFYDKWADKVKFLKRHYKLKISGLGLVQLQWEAGVETEERVQCVVVAERSLLRKTLGRLPRLFTYPHGTGIQVAYKEPQRLPDSDQLVYRPSKKIALKDFRNVVPKRKPLFPVQAPPRKKLNNGKRTLEKATSPAYRYSALSDLVDGYADIYGVVVNMTLPKTTSGRDLCMTVSVTDETCPTREKAIQINIFYPTIDKMPKITHVGDIIRFHKVKIQRYQDNIQGVSMSKVTRHLVLRESSGGNLNS